MRLSSSLVVNGWRITQHFDPPKLIIGRANHLHAPPVLIVDKGGVKVCDRHMKAHDIDTPDVFEALRALRLASEDHAYAARRERMAMWERLYLAGLEYCNSADDAERAAYKALKTWDRAREEHGLWVIGLEDEDEDEDEDVSENDDVTCRGSYVLGTACGKCSRCAEEREQMRQARKKKREGRE